MAIPASGPLSISAFNTELGRTSTTANSQLAGASTPAAGSLVFIAGQLGTLNQAAPHAFSEWYGYTAASGISFYDSSQATGTSITLPTGLLQNDIVIICSMSDDNTQALPSTYTNGQNGSTNSVNYRWSYKRMGATPDTTATGLTSGSIHIAIVFRNVNTTTVLDVSSPTIATNTSGMPNSPSITTSTSGAMVVAIGFLDDDLVTAGAPTNFTLARSATYGGAGAGGTVMAAYRLKSPAGAEDPGVFNGSGTDSWVGATLALRPV
jgi:hypothetical protein